MGTIGNLYANGSSVRITNKDYIGYYNSNSSTMINDGTINHSKLTGTAQTLNNGLMNSLQASNNTFTQNNKIINNADLIAGNGDHVVFLNNGKTKKLGAEVFSPNNTGFIDIYNNKLVISAELFDNVPWQPPVRRDLITYNQSSSGTTQKLKTGTTGIGEVDVINRGSIWDLYASGNTNIWNG